jgi:hypothetical protein
MMCVFTKLNTDDINVLEICCEEVWSFDPHILTAILEAANAGTNDPEVYNITRLEFPPSLLDTQQEKYCQTGRHPYASSDSDWYLLCLLLESYVVLLK